MFTLSFLFLAGNNLIWENSDSAVLAEENEKAENSSQGLSRSRPALGFTEISTGLPNDQKFNFVVAGDFSNDGNVDLVFSTEDTSTSYRGVHAYTGNGGVSWTNASTGLLWQYDWGGMALGDADADGYQEMYAADDNHGGSGNLGVKVWEYQSGSWTTSTAQVSSPFTTGRPDNVYLTNMTGSNKSDLVVCNNQGIKYFENTGGNPATWQENSSGLATANQFTGVTVADMNKDGLKDIITCDYNSNEYLYIQNTTGDRWVNYYTGVNISGRYIGVEVGDVNNDTHMDIVFGGVGNGLKCLLGNSGGVSGTSFSWTASNSGLTGGGNFLKIELADIDADGDLDIIAPRYGNPGGIHIYLGNGNTNPGTGMSWTLATNTNLTSSGDWMSVDCTDINGDGSQDIAAASWGNGIKAWLNNITLDVNPPGAVTDLTITNLSTTTIRVNWTSPADNGTDILSGYVRGYDIRYSTSNINAVNWATATECDNEPTPAATGTQESYTITGLQPGIRYYIGLKSSDERPNWSPLSNIVFDTTIGIPDTNLPGQIKDLQAINPTNNTINLTWSAPADNGSNSSSGLVSEYEIRYHSAQVTNSSWDSSIDYPNSIIPNPPGVIENLTITGLLPETTYYFAVKAFDEVPNIGWISNSALNTTLSDPDMTPPDAVTDLLAITESESTINLTWSAPGDDGASGTANEYDIRYATLTITDLTWDSATQCSSEPIPQVGGSIEYYPVTELNPETTYYFALKTADETLSWAGLSNVAFNTTMGFPTQDTTAPGIITDLTARQPTYNSITLTWTAPGDDGLIGTATGYDLRYEKSSITESTWDFATMVQNLSTPKPAGENESFTVTGLEPNTTYYFAIKASDEVPHWSPLSNVASETTLDDSLTILNATMIAGKTVLDSGESTNLIITVFIESPSEPVQEASVVLSSNNPSVTITPASSLTGPEGKLTVVITASEVTSETEVNIYADISKLRFTTLRREVTITIKQVVVTQPDFNLRITQERIKFSKTPLMDGDKITIIANVTNIGFTEANEFTVRFFLDSGQLGGDHQFLNLQVNDFIIVETPWTASAGEHTIKVEIIPLNPDYETDDSDNAAEVSFEVKSKDTDGDGKDRTSGTQFLVWLIILIIIVVIILILVFILVRKKRNQEPMTTGAPSVDKPVPSFEMTGTIEVDTPESAEDFQEPPIEEFETPAEPPSEEIVESGSIALDAPEDGAIAEALSESTATEPAVPMDESVISSELEAAPEPELPPQEPGEKPMEGATELAPGVSEPIEELPAENEHEQVSQQMMCPICQNLIPPHTTPCPQCGTELDWS